MTMLSGAPIDLASDYPQENSWAFQAFNVTADPWSARVFFGRTQGNLSELIAYEYDPAIPGPDTTCADWASASTMASLPDAIDLDEELSDRHVPLLFSYTPLPDALTGQVLLVGAVYETVTTYGGMMSFDADLGPGGDCDHADGAFCIRIGRTTAPCGLNRPMAQHASTQTAGSAGSAVTRKPTGRAPCSSIPTIPKGT